MRNMEVSDFLDYLGTEESNLLASLINLNQDLGLFQELDQIYRERLSVEQEKLDEYIIAMLYRYAHSQLCFSMSAFLRCHSKEAFSATRTAIDAGLAAYKILEEPGSEDRYLKGEREFVFIKRNIQQAREKDASKYPKAAPLIDFHEWCSKYASHADADVVVMHTEIVEDLKAGKKELKLHYFDIRRRKVEGQYFLIFLLGIYFHIFQVFRIFLDQKLPDRDRELDGRVGRLGEELKKRHAEYDRLNRRNSDATDELKTL
ncbi:MAG: hypothetical protein ACR2L2_03070 [Acidobacteriota bacterium]